MSYIKKTWVTGEAITASALNNLEEGVTEAKKEASQSGTSATNAQTAAANAAQAAQGAQTALNDHVGSEEAHPDIREAVSNLEERVTPVEKGGTGNTTGEAPTATKLATPRTIQVNLESTEATSFDGSANIAPGVKGILPSNRGGTGNSVGRAPSAYKLAIPRTIQVDLSSEDGASFDGSANIAPGVKGVLPVKLGGHGATDAAGARQNLGVPSVEEMMQRDRAWNVLDNSYFPSAYVINQRGASSYSGSWTRCIDRWICVTSGETKFWSNPTNVGVPAGGRIIQCLNVKAADVAGKTFTLAFANTTGTVYIGSNTVKPPTDSTIYHIAQNHDGVIVWLYSTETSGYLYACLYNNSSDNVPLVWAALYEGEYTADTLPAYVYKGYAAELAECQRYAVKTNGHGWGYTVNSTTMRLNIPVPTTMRTKPSVPSGLEFSVLVAGGSLHTLTEYSVAEVSSGIVRLTLTGTGFSSTRAPIVGYANEDFVLSSDL